MPAGLRRRRTTRNRVRPLAAGLAILNDPDTYLHIAAGRWMIAHRALPAHAPFSPMLAGAPWVPHEWLAEIVLAGTYVLAGWPDLVLLTGLCFAGALALLTRALLRRWEPFSASPRKRDSEPSHVARPGFRLARE
jgi:hypothetical protein